MKAQGILYKLPILQSFTHRKSNRIKKREQLDESKVKIREIYLRAIGSLTATIFTGTLFLGGSYLFFIQLAEYGW